MLSSLLIPLPVLAAQWALSITSEVIVHERGRVLAPRSLRGMPAERAAQLFPGSTVVPRRPDWEHAAWDRIVEEVWKITPYLTTVQPGRLVCSPDDLPRLDGQKLTRTLLVGVDPDVLLELERLELGEGQEPVGLVAGVELRSREGEDLAAEGIRAGELRDGGCHGAVI